MNQAMKEAYDKACAAAAEIEGFARDHPVFCTVVALGVLVILAPYVLEALGFGALAPVEGEFPPYLVLTNDDDRGLGEVWVYC